MRKQIFWTVLLVILLIVLDQGSKILVRAQVPLYHSSVLLPQLLELTHVQNKGISFSVLAGLSAAVRVPLLVGISLGALVILGSYWWRQRNTFSRHAHLGFQFIVAGAIGNLIDRAHHGFVTDFLHFRFYETSFFVNNLADIFISAGVLLYLFSMLMKKDLPPTAF